MHFHACKHLFNLASADVFDLSCQSSLCLSDVRAHIRLITLACHPFLVGVILHARDNRARLHVEVVDLRDACAQDGLV